MGGCWRTEKISSNIAAEHYSPENDIDETKYHLIFLTGYKTIR